MKKRKGKKGEEEGEEKEKEKVHLTARYPFPGWEGHVRNLKSWGFRRHPMHPCFLESTKRKWQTSQDIWLRFAKKTHPRFGLFSEGRVGEMWFKYENCSWMVMEIMTLSTALSTAGCSSKHETVGENHLGMWAGWATDEGGTQESIFCQLPRKFCSQNVCLLIQVEGKELLISGAWLDCKME